MTRKDYVNIATAIRSTQERIRESVGAWMTKDVREAQLRGVRRTAAHICDALAADNPRFDAARFLSECGYGATTEETAAASSRPPADQVPDMVEAACVAFFNKMAEYMVANSERFPSPSKIDFYTSDVPEEDREAFRDAMRAAIAALQAVPVASEVGWQPIETLPAVPEPDAPQQHYVFWNGETLTVGVREGEYQFGDALWIDRDGDMNPVWPMPTHWRPLPEPPALKASGEE
jgi:hypothetical protein